MNALILSIVIAALFLTGAVISVVLAFKAAKRNAINKINNRSEFMPKKAAVKNPYTLAK
jgi:hypothetical protein